jgi:starch synthase (maltosyl-transferring)
MVIEHVEPELDSGRYAVKQVVGDLLRVRADIFKEGHEVIAAAVRWRQVSPPADALEEWNESPMRPLGNDRFEAEFPLARNGRYAYTIDAWPDTVRTWASEIQRKVAVGQPIASELIEGAALLRQAAQRAGSGTDGRRLAQAEKILLSEPPATALSTALDPAVLDAASRHPDRSVATRYDRELQVYADRRLAMTGAWYELFPRSASRDERRHGTFKDVEALLPEIARLGFDVLYLPPIHPIGKAGRKGRDNALNAAPGDPGSPWAIGSAEGGHKSIHPELGTLKDFRALVDSAKQKGLEVALDLAFQCSPDHPYVKEHPEWFSWRPDGTLKTAENPPKRYEDIVNFDFLGPARESLWAELKSVVLFWIEQGIRIFRVDNPHTKPLMFWSWLIREVQDRHPEVVFLAEAFTRPKVMKALAKAGFTQSYTYFTWRIFKGEIEQYLQELTQGPEAEYMRGNLWPNTPDILSEFLQQGGPPAFKIRLVLAATLSSSYGLYSGYELCEARGVPGTEEYRDSEKYQLVRWDPERPGNIRPFVEAINRIRRENAALQLYRNLRFHRADNDRVVFYGKSTPDRSNQILVAVSLDPHSPQPSRLEVPLSELAIGPDETYQVHELLSGERVLWKGEQAQVTLTPDRPAAIWSVLRFSRRENAFDYYY